MWTIPSIVWYTAYNIYVTNIASQSVIQYIVEFSMYTPSNKTKPDGNTNAQVIKQMGANVYTRRIKIDRC